MQRLHINCADGYDVNIGRGILSSCAEYFNLSRKVFIVTDSRVPREYAEAVMRASRNAVIYTVNEGEGAKSLKVFGEALSAMAEFGLSRSDCMVAVGGGVVGDLTGFLAATYMRGIDFYNIPTTLLSQVDSSVGGKCAVNLDGIKNIVGAFKQPCSVLIDTDTLKTLSKRHFSAGLCEALKMSLTSSAELFEFFENNDINEENIEHVITEALKIKASVVELDERESGLRKILNFGHTLGHGIESVEGLSGLYHGECVALGMIPTSSPAVRKRLIPVLEKLSLPTSWSGNLDDALKFVQHDKKAHGDTVDAIFVDTPGSFEIKKVSRDEFAKIVREGFSQ